MAKIEQMKLSDICIDAGTQQRVTIDQAIVKEYVEHIDDLPPVDVFVDGVKRYLADGFHRYYAHIAAKRKTICVYKRVGLRRDAILFSIQANHKHGLRRSVEDKKKTVVTLLQDKEWSRWSDRKIASACGVSHPFVADQRRALTGNVSSQDSANRSYEHGKSGKPTTMNTAPIAASNAARSIPPIDDIDSPNTDPIRQPEPQPEPPRYDAPPPTDEEGNPLLRDELVRVFGERQRLQDLMTAISRIKTTVLDALGEGDELFRYINETTFKADCENVRRALVFAMPYAMCPYHADDPVARKGCKCCGGSGWTVEDKWKAGMAAMGKGKK